MKDDRSREWDRVIAEAKAELGQTPSKGVVGEHGRKTSSESDTKKEELKTYSPWTGHGARQTFWKDTGVARDSEMDAPMPFPKSEEGYTRYSPRYDVAQGRTDGSTKFETKLKALDHKIRMASRYDLKVDVETEHASDLEWVDEEPDMVLYERDPVDPVHLRRRELSCATLIEQLLTRLVGSIEQRRQKSQDQKAHPELQDMVVRIQHLRQKSGKLPSYKWEDLEVIGQERRALHRSLMGICNAAVPDDIPSLELMVAKICYNLLVFQSPISMVTYNVLVQSLGHLKQYDLAQVFVDSFFYDTRLKPNHNSISIIVEHYHQKNDLEGWRQIRDRMRASRVDFDMRIKRRWHGEIGRPSIQRWIRATHPSDLKLQKGRGPKDPAKYVSQKAPRDCNAFNALIRSSLSFAGPRNAILHIKRALLDYQDIYSETICEVMEELLKQRDGRGSTSLINSILSIWEEGSDPDAITFTGSVRRLIYQLLDMIGVDTTLGSQLTPPNQLSLTAVQALLRQMHMMSIYEALDRSATFIGTIEAHLEEFLSTRSGINRYITTLQPELSQSQRNFEEYQMSDLSHAHVEEVDRRLPSEMVEPENVPKKELPPLGWFAEVEKARDDDLEWNKASGRLARLEHLEKQLLLSMQRLQGTQDRALPFLLKAMPRYQQLRYLDITSSNMVYRKREERPRQYDELLRVCGEGTMGLFNFAQRQLDYRKIELSKIETEGFLIIPANRLSMADLEHYIARATDHIVVNEEKGAALRLRSAKLAQISKFLQAELAKESVDITRTNSIATKGLDDIAKQLRKVEIDFDAANVHQTNLLNMKETLETERHRRLVVKLQQMVKRSANLLGKFEDDLAQLTQSPMPCTLQRAAWLVRESDLKVRSLVSELRAVRYEIREQRRVDEQRERELQEIVRKSERAKYCTEQRKKRRESVHRSDALGLRVENPDARLEARDPSQEDEKTEDEVSGVLANLSLQDNEVSQWPAPAIPVAGAAAG